MSGQTPDVTSDGLEARGGAATRLPSDATHATQDVLLDVRDLSVVYESAGQTAVQAVDHVSFSLRKGEFVGLVGESGSGKSTLGYALTRLQKPPARTNGGSIVFAGSDIRDLDDEALRQQRQGGFAMVLQSGMNALNPVRTVRNHFVDVFKAHGHVPRERWDARMRELVSKVKLPETMLARYPGELSGGMRQRVSIALALSLEPQLMVFDEPTTALDVLVQHAVMDTIIELQRSEGFTAILISHDLGIVLEATERVLVMHEGRIVEDGRSLGVLRDPQDDYTKMLLSHYADPRAAVVSLPGFPDRSLRSSEGATRRQTTSSFSTVGSRERSAARNPIVVDHLVKTYPAPRRGEQPVQAVRDVSFTLEPGQSLALVGQSGSGKSTIAKMLTGVEQPTSGTVRFGDTDVARLGRRGLKDLRSEVQMVFQDPIANYTRLRGRDARRRMLEILETVGLTPVEQFAQKLPHQLSGGQRQRVVIARALASDPQVIIADEPVSMLDVTLRAGVLALLEDLREQWGVSLLYITHDLLSARLITDDIMVLHDGAVVELGRTAEVLQHPQDDYTVALLDAVPNPRRTLLA
ncbi:ABC transporter ATP-binding protein [Curtobacterium sp. Csp1]|uniref:ABC transporter ATP-binding protein n=1 Tax=Curtobacterium sp. Csp1 TaxID=2495429 RepID=UPI001598A44D|nr:ABC transporter ATP-binding protein [Curtobacterium sp. Csp1]QKS21853.1 ABC transporter ATP-binding protein [Curtobacterium sp. Csp1]